MVRCSGAISPNCLGFTDEVYRLERGIQPIERPAFGLCAECLLAARSLGIPVVLVHEPAVRALTWNPGDRCGNGDTFALPA